MTINYILAPNALWQGRDATGQPIINGQLFTYENQTRIPKATFQDPAGVNPNTNPVILDGAGEAPIYWANDDFYSIALYDQFGELIFTADNYPNVDSSGGGDITIVEQSDNMMRNANFSYWDGSGNSSRTLNSPAKYTPIYSNGTQGSDIFCDDWNYRITGDTSGVHNMERKSFLLGDNSVPGTPVYYNEFTCTTAAAAETEKNIWQSFKSVQTQNNAQVSFSFWAQSSSSSTISVVLHQFFGTGGTPSSTVETAVLTAVLTPTWTQFTAVATLPSVSGKISGTNNDDSLSLIIKLPLNQTCSIDMTAVQLIPGNLTVPFPYLTLNNQNKILDERSQALFTTGDIRHSFQQNIPPGWLLCDGNTIGSINSGSHTARNDLKALFIFLWAVVPNLAIFDSSGTLTTKGVSAEADWQALKRLSNVNLIDNTLAQASSVSGHGFGQQAGSNTVTASTSFIISINQMPPHTHNYTGYENTNPAGTGGASARLPTALITSSTGGGNL